MRSNPSIRDRVFYVFNRIKVNLPKLNLIDISKGWLNLSD